MNHVVPVLVSETSRRAARTMARPILLLRRIPHARPRLAPPYSHDLDDQSVQQWTIAYGHEASAIVLPPHCVRPKQSPRWSCGQRTSVAFSDSSGARNGCAVAGDACKCASQGPFNVLEAEDLPSALRVAKTHSRPIQLLVNAIRYDDAFTELMQQFRPGMEVMRVAREQMFNDPKAVLEEIRRFFSPTAKKPTQNASRDKIRNANLALRTQTAEAS